MLRILFALACFAVFSPEFARAQEEKNQNHLLNFEESRYRLVEWIQAVTAVSGQTTGVKAIDKNVLKAMATVPRHEFVPAKIVHYAYLDTPLPIGYGQNISQPSLIALMTHLVQIKKDDVVYETGTGPGYQAAILSLLAKQIFSVEFSKPLAAQAAERLQRLKYNNVKVRAGDGYYGWREEGPFDVIMVKEAIHSTPDILLAQLKRGGRMIAPIGPLQGAQQLTLIEKDQNGKIKTKNILSVRFSPLPGGERL